MNITAWLFRYLPAVTCKLLLRKKAAVTFLFAAAPLICGIRVLQVQFFSYGNAVRYAISPLLSFLDLPASAFFGTVTSR